MTREQREQQAQHQSLQQTVDEYLKENPIDDDLSPEVEAQITALKLSSPHLSPRDLLKAAHERALWSNPARRQQLIAKERAADEAKRAEESAKRASEAKRAASVNVRSTPGNARPARNLDDELSAIYDRARSA
jgi:hypothetical protein